MKTKDLIFNAYIIVLIGLFKYGQNCTFYEKLQPNLFQPSKTNDDNDNNNDHDHDHDNNVFTSQPRSGCLFVKTFLHAIQVKLTLTIIVEICCVFHLDFKSFNKSYIIEGVTVIAAGLTEPSRAGLEPPAFRLTAECANRLRHGDFQGETYNFRQILLCGLNFNLRNVTATLMYHARKT